MFPLRDENPTTVFAWVTLVFIAVCVLVFFEVQLAGSAAEQDLLLYESASLPAFLYLAVWFFLQFTLGGSNTAWEAHVGGFVFGALISLLFRSRLAVGSPAHRSRLA